MPRVRHSELEVLAPSGFAIATVPTILEYRNGKDYDIAGPDYVSVIGACRHYLAGGVLQRQMEILSGESFLGSGTNPTNIDVLVAIHRIQLVAGATPNTPRAELLDALTFEAWLAMKLGPKSAAKASSFCEKCSSD